jgi:hypothetical protein
MKEGGIILGGASSIYESLYEIRGSMTHSSLKRARMVGAYLGSQELYEIRLKW